MPTVPSTSHVGCSRTGRITLPQSQPACLFHGRLRRLQALLMDVGPGLAELADIDGAVHDRLGAVIDEDEKTGGQQHQSEHTTRQSGS